MDELAVRRFPSNFLIGPLHDLAASDGLEKRSEPATGAGLALFRLTRVATEMMDRSLCFPTILSVIHGSCCMSTASSAGAVPDCITACVYETVRNGVSMENASSNTSMQIFSATSKRKENTCYRDLHVS